MENNYVFLLYVFVWLIFILRIIYVSIFQPHKSIRYLLLSCYIVSSAFLLGKEIYGPFEDGHILGSLGRAYIIGGLQIIPMLLLMITRTKTEISQNYIQKKTPVILLLILLGISVFNPYNLMPQATYIAIFYILSFILFGYIIFRTMEYEEIINGLWDGLCILAVIELFLAILFPVLDVTLIPNIFNSPIFDDGLRRRASGTFIHPNLFASIMSYIVSFFFACYLCDYKKKKALLFTIIAFCALLLTLSRSAIIAAMVILCLLFFISKYPHIKLISAKTIFQFILPSFILIIGIILFTPLRDYFIGANADAMLDARQAHNLYYLTLMPNHPIIGVGLNTHIEYFNQFYMGIEFEGLSLDFASTNPVHNIYVLLMMEVGIIGLIIFFILMFRNISASKKMLSINPNLEDNILPLTSIACIIAVFVHGMSDYTVLSIQNMMFWVPICLIANFINQGNLNSLSTEMNDVEDE